MMASKFVVFARYPRVTEVNDTAFQTYLMTIKSFNIHLIFLWKRACEHVYVLPSILSAIMALKSAPGKEI